MAARKKSLYKVLDGLPLLRNPYLNVQAQNIGVVDDLLQQMEADVWREYRRTDKTPFPAFMIVNALSQMWIFALYELLRTWRQMVNEVIRYHEQIEVIRNDSEFEEKIKRLRQGKKKKTKRLPQSEEMEDLFYNEGFRQVESDPTFAHLLQKTLEIVNPTFRQISDLRMALAKHEIAGTNERGASGMRAYAPGYARFDTLRMTGALCWFIETKDGYEDIISRAGIVENIQKLRIPAHKK